MSDDLLNNETMPDNSSKQKPWQFSNKRSLEHRHQNLNVSREPKIDHSMPKYYSLDEIDLPNLENINPNQLNKKLHNNLNMRHENSILTEDYYCHNQREQNDLDQDESIETISHNSEDEIKNLPDTHEIILDNGEKITIAKLKK
ncbi:hypothetical protein [Candidatus Liberibacter americanus]|nr:hypothetical protein [Candidatus Liberibacter americanus]